MKVTPQWIATFETDTQTFVVDAWQRVLKDLMWDKFMDRRQSSTLRELYFWLVESASIRPEGQGGNKRYDDIGASFYEIDNANSGVGLILTKNEIEDNMMAGPSVRGMPALDYAQNWAKQVGGHAAYWPQQQLFTQLIANGKTANGYDGVPFFSASHPVNVLSGTATYSNLATAMPLLADTDAHLLASAGYVNAVAAQMRGFKQPNGQFRRLRPAWLLHAPGQAYAVSKLLGSKFFNASDNVLTQMGIMPICADELSAEDGVWYMGAELMPGEGGPFIYQDREPYTLTSYTSDSQIELNRRKVFEWLFDGRNAVAYGHPYLIIRVEPT
ncbi:MAG TPA: Mu-like prophage major head subunit gpT family protein [Polyangiaceae bacterium]